MEILEEWLAGFPDNIFPDIHESKILGKAK